MHLFASARAMGKCIPVIEYLQVVATTLALVHAVRPTKKSKPVVAYQHSTN